MEHREKAITAWSLNIVFTFVTCKGFYFMITTVVCIVNNNCALNLYIFNKKKQIPAVSYTKLYVTSYITVIFSNKQFLQIWLHLDTSGLYVRLQGPEPQYTRVRLLAKLWTLAIWRYKPFVKTKRKGLCR